MSDLNSKSSDILSDGSARYILRPVDEPRTAYFYYYYMHSTMRTAYFDYYYENR